MTEQCPRCHYSTNIKGNLKAHFLRKVPCKSIYCDTPVDILLRNKFPVKRNNFVCKDCGKEYSSRQGLYVHLQGLKCKNKDTDIRILLHQLVNEIQELKTQPRVTNNNNIQVNTTIANFGHENIEHISESMKKQFLLNKEIVKLINTIHWDPKVPENKNIRYKTNDYLEVCVDGQWVQRDCTNSLDELMSKGYTILAQYFLNNMFSDPDLSDQQRNEYLHQWISDIGAKKGNYYSQRRELLYTIKNNTLILFVGNDHMPEKL